MFEKNTVKPTTTFSDSVLYHLKKSNLHGYSAPRCALNAWENNINNNVKLRHHHRTYKSKLKCTPIRRKSHFNLIIAKQPTQVTPWYFSLFFFYWISYQYVSRVTKNEN